MALLITEINHHDGAQAPDAGPDAVNGHDAQENPSSPSSTEAEGVTTYGIIRQYLLERVPEFQRLTDLRRQVCNE